MNIPTFNDSAILIALLQAIMIASLAACASGDEPETPRSGAEFNGPTGLRYDTTRTFAVELPAGAPTGEASIREHTIAWHPGKQKYYLVADVVPLNNPHHPNTYDTSNHSRAISPTAASSRPSSGMGGSWRSSGLCSSRANGMACWDIRRRAIDPTPSGMRR